MSKPNVFPQKTADSNNKPLEKIETSVDYEEGKIAVMTEIYSTSKEEVKNNDYINAIEQMYNRTNKQISGNRNFEGIEQPKTRETQLEYNQELLKKYDESVQNIMNQPKHQQKELEYKNPKEEIKIMEENKIQTNQAFIEISQPTLNAPFDVLELPSGGLHYKTKQKTVNVSYLTTADENILTSPNILNSGKFLEILLNRKILDYNLRYNDLLPGDRNAIMIWLRSTGYGEMYPITVLDENGVAFETEVDLSTIPIKKSKIVPDENGLYTFVLPLTKKEVKFKLLNCGEIKDLEELLNKDEENGEDIVKLRTYKFEKMIKSVDGESDLDTIKSISENMRLGDAKALDLYIEECESGPDLMLDIKTPGGGSVSRFLPLSIEFFWPEF